eukprot:1323185-Amorphochlora_amoeboformis.AAC.1
MEWLTWVVRVRERLRKLCDQELLYVARRSRSLRRDIRFVVDPRARERERKREGEIERNGWSNGEREEERERERGLKDIEKGIG